MNTKSPRILALACLLSWCLAVPLTSPAEPQNPGQRAGEVVHGIDCGGHQYIIYNNSHLVSGKYLARVRTMSDRPTETGDAR